MDGHLSSDLMSNTSSSSSVATPSEAALARLLALSRQAIADGDSQLALASVLHAIRLTQGDDAIAGLLDEAKLTAAREAAAAASSDGGRCTDAARGSGSGGGGGATSTREDAAAVEPSARRRFCCGGSEERRAERERELQCGRERERQRASQMRKMEHTRQSLAAQTDALIAERDASRTDVLHDAFVDGSSVVCQACGGLVPRTRWEAHCTLWCDALEDDAGGGSESD